MASGTLDTVDGPAFKPLPVAVAAALQPLDGLVAVPDLWLVVARAGAVAAVLLAGRLALRLVECRDRQLGADDPDTRPLRARAWGAALVAGGGVLLAQGWLWHAAVGNAEGLFLALVLAAVERGGLDRRHGQALALALGAALLRPELWPFLGLYGLWLLVRVPHLRVAVLLAGPALLAVWFLPELWGSGDAFRSSERARIPNPGQPALADVPALASLEAALPIALAPVLVLAALALARNEPALSRCVALGGAAWVGLVAVMAELGYSGEPRYALPGAAVLAVPAGVALAGLRRELVAVGLVAVAVAGVLRLDGARGELERAADDARLWDSLPAAIERAGGREVVLARGRPVTGRLRGPGVAYALEVRKRDVGFDPAQAGVLLRSRIRSGQPVMPPAPAARPVLARSARWELR